MSAVQHRRDTSGPPISWSITHTVRGAAEQVCSLLYLPQRRDLFTFHVVLMFQRYGGIVIRLCRGAAWIGSPGLAPLNLSLSFQPPRWHEGSAG
jgi:hypothetical protein